MFDWAAEVSSPRGFKRWGGAASHRPGARLPSEEVVLELSILQQDTISKEF